MTLPINTRIHFVNTRPYWSVLEEGAIVRHIGGCTYEVANAGLRFSTIRAVHGQDFITHSQLVDLVEDWSRRVCIGVKE